MEPKSIIQAVNIAGILVNLEMLAINHYYGVDSYIVHVIGLGFFVVSLICVKLSTVV